MRSLVRETGTEAVRVLYESMSYTLETASLIDAAGSDVNLTLAL